MPNIVIIGGGPAGLSAAIYAVRAGMQATVLYKDGGALAKTDKIENYFGFIEPVSGAELLERGQKQVERLGAVLRQTEVTGIEYAAQGFTVKTADGVFDADAVILATGSPRAVPKIEGVAAFEGRGVSYCATCDAPLYRGATVAVIGYQKSEEAEADFLADIAEKVYYFPMYKEPVEVSEKITVVNGVPKEITGGMKADTLVTSAGSYPADCIFILRESVSPKNLVPGLQMDGNHVAVNLQMETNVPGCFACGDIAGRPYQYIKSAGQGNIAALSAVSYLDQKRRNEKQ